MIHERNNTLLANQISIMGQVITALILRETKTRFGRNKFGYIWALVEPAAYVAIFIAVRSQLKATTPFGESLILFVLTGLLTFRIFMSVANRGIAAIKSNKAMLTYPPVKPTDVILARITLELLTMYVMFFMFFSFLMVTAETKVIVNHQHFAGAILGITFLSIGVSFLNATLACVWPTWERIWNIFRLPILLLSGIFYVPNKLPTLAQDIIWWNPIVHCVEWLRTATYLSYDPMLNKAYIFGFATITLCAGLLIERIFKSKILAI